MEDQVLKPEERMDELGRKGYRIIQDTTAFCFGMDAVLLADFAEIKGRENVLDMGTGSGILPLLLKARDRGNHITGLEIQPKMAALAVRNAALNGLSEEISIVQGDIREASQRFGKSVFDAVVSNPPYMDENHGLVNPEEAKAIARHELLLSLEDVIREAAAVLKPGGDFYMVHRPRRLAEIISLMRQYKLEPKRLRLVHSFADSEAEMLLIQGTRGGKPWMRVESPLIIYREKAVYTDEIYEMYFGRTRSEREAGREEA